MTLGAVRLQHRGAMPEAIADTKTELRPKKVRLK